MSKYPKKGPFQNGGAPGIDQTFLNDLETYVGYAADSNISADGSGNMTVGGQLTVQNNITISNGHRLFIDNDNGIVIKDDKGNAKLVIFVDTNGELLIQQAGQDTKIRFCNNVSGTLASIDKDGNMRLKGTLTQNTTP